MQEPPKLAESTLQEAIQAHYGLSVAALTFLPIGNDSESFVYRVNAADGKIYFLKVRTGAGFSPPSLIIPRFLFEQGIPLIITPLPTITGALWINVDSFAVSLYPFIDARTATAAGLSQQQWSKLGTALRQIHTCQLPSELQTIVPTELFVPSRRHVLNDLAPIMSNHNLANPCQRQLAEFWRSNQDHIRLVIDTADQLGLQLRHAPPPFVLCHADFHTWNVLLDTDQQLWIVDWDEIVLAPKERDLMFVIGGIGRDLVRPYETTSFLQGYGDTAIDQRALMYYRYAWAVQDMAAYAEQVFFAPDISDEARNDAMRGFIDQFAPGNIVAIAAASTAGAC